MKKFFRQELTLNCTIDTSDPEFYVIEEVRIPRAVFEHLCYHEPKYGDYWHGVLADGWAIANLSSFFTREAATAYAIISDGGLGSDNKFLIPTAIVAGMSLHGRLVREG